MTPQPQRNFMQTTPHVFAFELIVDTARIEDANPHYTAADWTVIINELLGAKSAVLHITTKALPNPKIGDFSLGAESTRLHNLFEIAKAKRDAAKTPAQPQLS